MGSPRGAGGPGVESLDARILRWLLWTTPGAREEF